MAEYTQTTDKDIRHIITGLGSHLLNLDIYGSGFSMKIDKDRMRLPTWVGTFFSLITIFIISWYTFQKTDILFQKLDTNVIGATNAQYFT